MINLTPAAADKVKESLNKRGTGLGIMIGVKTTGCSGLAYTLEYVDCLPNSQEYSEFQSNDVKIWIDHKSLIYLKGLTMDWIKKGLNEGFDFVNPNESGRCGCGESFTV